MSNKKQTSIEWFASVTAQLGYVSMEILEQAKAMHKEEVKMIIEHYHNNMFYLELSEKELKNITEMIYKETFGGQDNEN